MSEILCPVCSASAAAAYKHPDTIIYRCRDCRHAFSPPEKIDRLESYSAEYYEVIHRNWFRHPNVALFSWISARLPDPTASLVDIGCGKGDFLRHLRAHRPSLRLFGIDLSPNSDEPGIEFLQGDILTVEIHEKFDAVVSLAVIEHVPDITAFVRRLVELGRPGSFIAVMTLNESGLLYRIARLVRRFGISTAFDRLYSTHHLHHFTPESLQMLLERAGMEIVNVHHHNAPLRAIDVPARNAVLSALMKFAVSLVFAASQSTGACYLQTVVARIPETPANTS